LNTRGVFNVAFGLLACAGFTILEVSTHPVTLYAATFLCAIGIYPCIPNAMAWTASNIQGVYKRGVFYAAIISWSNLNGIMSSNVYRPPDSPYYRKGHLIVLGYLAVCLVGGSILNMICLNLGNKMREAGGESLKKDVLEGLTEEEIDDLVDFHPDFRYTL
jgi:hypothetical protein